MLNKFMNHINNFVEYGIVLMGAAFFIFLGIRYLQYWGEVKKAIEESGMPWPLHSQKEINETARDNLSKGYEVMWSDFGQAGRIIFSMRTDNPAILRPLRGMRRILLAFILFPILLAFILVVGLAFVSV